MACSGVKPARSNETALTEELQIRFIPSIWGTGFKVCLSTIYIEFVDEFFSIYIVDY
jgi:hypothetical protein